MRRPESEWKARSRARGGVKPAGAALLIIATTLWPSPLARPSVVHPYTCVCLRTGFHIDSTGFTNKETLSARAYAILRTLVVFWTLDEFWSLGIFFQDSDDDVETNRDLCPQLS